MKIEMLYYKKTWVLIGVAMVAFVIFDTLISSPILVPANVSDKFLHIFGYFSMMGWFVQIYQRLTHKLLLAVFFFSMGVSLEFLQGWGGVRQYEIADMLANLSGVLIAGILSFTRFANILTFIDARIYRYKKNKMQ